MFSLWLKAGPIKPQNRHFFNWNTDSVHPMHNKNMSSLMWMITIAPFSTCSLPPRRRISWWRHQMETFSVWLALSAANLPVPVNSPHKGQWRGALMFSSICVWIHSWANNREAGDLSRHRGHYDVNVMYVIISVDLVVCLLTTLQEILWMDFSFSFFFRIDLTRRNEQSSASGGCCVQPIRYRGIYIFFYLIHWKSVLATLRKNRWPGSRETFIFVGNERWPWPEWTSLHTSSNCMNKKWRVWKKCNYVYIIILHVYIIILHVYIIKYTCIHNYLTCINNALSSGIPVYTGV